MVRAHYAALVAIEGVVNEHYIAWKRAERTPLKPILDAMYARWLALPTGHRLVLEWLSVHCPDRPAGLGRVQVRVQQTIQLIASKPTWDSQALIDALGEQVWK